MLRDVEGREREREVDMYGCRVVQQAIEATNNQDREELLDRMEASSQVRHPRVLVLYRGTSLIRERTPLGPYRRPMSRVLAGWKPPLRCDARAF